MPYLIPSFSAISNYTDNKTIQITATSKYMNSVWKYHTTLNIASYSENVKLKEAMCVAPPEVKGPIEEFHIFCDLCTEIYKLSNTTQHF